MSSSDRAPIPVRLTEAELPATGVRSLVLRRTNGAPLPAWEPGAHIDLLLPDGHSRQYSLCGDPGDTTQYRISILREDSGRGGSRWIHDDLSVGDVVRIRPPRNHFKLEPASGYVFVAGGIGITPILPMLRHAVDGRTPWRLTYGGRTRSSMAFLDEVDVHGDRVTIAPQDETGLIDVAGAVDQLSSGNLLYTCGPQVLIDAVLERARATGRGDQVRYELFSLAPTADAEEVGRSYAVQMARSGRVVTVGPTTSILEAVRAAGADVVSDCEDGICGSCETPILHGRVEHRDHVLTDAEKADNKCLMLCVSRSLGDCLVLDL